MGVREVFQEERRWAKKVLIMDMLHCLKIYQTNGKWTTKDTATYFDCSIGLVSENLQLAQAIKDYPELEILSRNRALQELRRFKDANRRN